MSLTQALVPSEFSMSMSDGVVSLKRTKRNCLAGSVSASFMTATKVLYAPKLVEIGFPLL